MSKEIENLNNLKQYEFATIQTPYGAIFVQRVHGDNGAAIASIQRDEFPDRDRTVQCQTPRQAFEHQLRVLKEFLVEMGEIELAEATAKVAVEPKRDLVALRDKVAQILQSKHVASVEVAFEYSDGNRRYYTAITRETNIPHKYTVRVEDSFENGELVTTGRCNCLGFVKYAKCRHIQKVSDFDAKRMSREVYPLELANYRGHLRAA